MVKSTRGACGVFLNREVLARPELLSLLRLDGSGLPDGAGNSNRPAEQLLSFLMRFLCEEKAILLSSLATMNRLLFTLLSVTRCLDICFHPDLQCNTLEIQFMFCELQVEKGVEYRV